MTSLTQTAHPTASLAHNIRAIFGTVALRAKAFMRAYLNRHDAQMLAAFDDRMLADIGLTRGDVRDAFSEPVWRDPTAVLRKRVLERRTYRRRAVGVVTELQVIGSPSLAPEHAFRRPSTDRPARLAV